MIFAENFSLFAHLVDGYVRKRGYDMDIEQRTAKAHTKLIEETMEAGAHLALDPRQNRSFDLWLEDAQELTKARFNSEHWRNCGVKDAESYAAELADVLVALCVCVANEEARTCRPMKIVERALAKVKADVARGVAHASTD